MSRILAVSANVIVDCTRLWIKFISSYLKRAKMAAHSHFKNLSASLYCVSHEQMEVQYPLMPMAVKGNKWYCLIFSSTTCQCLCNCLVLCHDVMMTWKKFTHYGPPHESDNMLLLLACASSWANIQFAGYLRRNDDNNIFTFIFRIK